MKEYLIKTSSEADVKYLFRVYVWDFGHRGHRYIYSSILSANQEEADRYLTKFYRSMYEMKIKVEFMQGPDWEEGRSAQEKIFEEAKIEKQGKYEARKMKMAATVERGVA